MLQPAGRHIYEIEVVLFSITELRGKPFGAIWITAGDHSAQTFSGRNEANGYRGF